MIVEPTDIELFVIRLLYGIYGKSFVLYRSNGRHLYGYSL